MTAFKKTNFPLSRIREHLEPGPIVLVSSKWKEETNIMAMGWHVMLSFSPALFGTYLWDGNHSFEMLRRSKECVINVPTVDLVNEVVGIGNSSGDGIDKFKKFGLTPVPGLVVKAPAIKECYASFECKLIDAKLIPKYGLFIWRVVKAHIAASVKSPQTIHYRGQGVFMVAGRTINRRKKFKPQNL
jgi:flavin reductase (DIM6/NTAB) family NADH-FMN oxidoreductase RutF